MTLRRMKPAIVLASRDGQPQSADDVFDCADDDPNLNGIKVLEPLEISWGRDELMDNPEAAVATFTFLDPSRYMMSRIKDDQLIGKPVTIWAAEDGNYTPSSTSPNQWVMFRGRITDATIEVAQRNSDGEPKSYFIRMTAAGPEADLGNIIMTDKAVWPAENLQARATRIRDLAKPRTLVDNMFFEPEHVNFTCNAMEVDGKSLLDLARMLYWSDGEPMTYIPSENVFRSALGPEYYLQEPEGWIGVALRERGAQGDPLYRVFAPTPDNSLRVDATNTPPSSEWPGLYISGCEVGSEDSELFQSPMQGPNVVVVNHWDGTAGWNKMVNTKTANVLDYWKTGERAMRVESMLDDAWQIHLSDQAPARIILYNASYKGSIPNHPDLHIRVPEDGFLSFREAKNYLDAGYKPFCVFIGGAPWTDYMGGGTPPYFMVIGGTMRFEHGHWDINWKLHPISKTQTLPSVTWADYSVDNSALKWARSANTSGTWVVDRAVTWSDMRHVNNHYIYGFQGDAI